jgi:hypothetical protein
MSGEQLVGAAYLAVLGWYGLQWAIHGAIEWRLRRRERASMRASMRAIPRRPSTNPADEGPPLEDLEVLVARAERHAEREWIAEHGALPEALPFRRWRPSPSVEGPA